MHSQTEADDSSLLLSSAFIICLSSKRRSDLSLANRPVYNILLDIAESDRFVNWWVPDLYKLNSKKHRILFIFISEPYNKIWISNCIYKVKNNVKNDMKVKTTEMKPNEWILLGKNIVKFQWLIWILKFYSTYFWMESIMVSCQSKQNSFTVWMYVHTFCIYFILYPFDL